MIKQLQDGLILRTLSEGHARDREQLPDFHANINGEGDPDSTKEGLRRWVRSLINGHPTVTGDDIFVVVNPAQDDEVIAATTLIPQTWQYSGIEIGVGRPELVATHPDYRNRGIVRTIFDAVHERSALLGHHLQAITGIPYFYRKFGYTMAVELGTHAAYQLSSLPDPNPDEPPAYRLRAAKASDAPVILEWSGYFSHQRLLSDSYPLMVQQFDIEYSQRTFPPTHYLIIEQADGTAVGYLDLWSPLPSEYAISCTAFVVGDGASYLAVFKDVMMGVRAWAETTNGRKPDMLLFGAGIHEALNRLIERSPGGLVRQHEQYAWYLRLADPVAFLRHITPVLEQRLHGSGAHRYTGELRIGYFNFSGIRFAFENGQITCIEAITGDDYDAQFPWNLYWNVIFGYRTVDEIHAVVPEAGGSAKAAVLLDILFPKVQSWLRGLA